MMKNDKDKIPMSSDAYLFRKHKIIETVMMIIIILAGIIASIMYGLERGYPASFSLTAGRIVMAICLVVIIIAFIIFSISYFKIKKMKDDD